VSSPLPVVFTRRAERHVQEAGSWWKKNRTKAPGALAEELRNALRFVASQPDVGAIAVNVKLPGVRRVLARRVNFYLYY
jgi:plasmid stabilization system protein ParE